MPTQFDSFNQEFLNEIDVSGRILSAGVDLFNLFSGGGGGSGDTTYIQGFTGNWNSTYNTVSSLSSYWSALPTLSFGGNSVLSISGSNSVSLSGFQVVEKSPTFRYTSADVLTGITYQNGNTKTLSYADSLLTQQVYVRTGVTTTYTYNYSINNILTSISTAEVFS